MALSQANTTNSAVPEGFQLATEQRAKDRMEFEKELSEKGALRARMEEERTREREEREKEETARLRQEQVSFQSDCLSSQAWNVVNWDQVI